MGVQGWLRKKNQIEDCDREGILKRCKEGTQRKYNVQCVDRTANFQVLVSATKMKTGEVIYSETTTGKQTDTYCKNQSSPRESDVAPYYTTDE
jgi:hypothetical protein